MNQLYNNVETVHKCYGLFLTETDMQSQFHKQRYKFAENEQSPAHTEVITEMSKISHWRLPIHFTKPNLTSDTGNHKRQYKKHDPLSQNACNMRVQADRAHDFVAVMLTVVLYPISALG